MNTQIVSKRPDRRMVLLAALTFACLLIPAVAKAATVPLIDENFNDGDRTGWYNSSTSGGLSASTGALVSTSGTPTIVTYFSSTTLAVGESLTLNFDFSAAGITDSTGGFRFGLLKSGASTVSGDNFTAVFSDYLGYQARTNMGSSAASQTAVYERNDTVTTSLLGGTWGQVGSSAVGVNLTAGNTYAVMFKIERTGETSVTMSFSMNGVVISSVVDTTASTFTFDTLGFFENGTAASSTTYDNISLIYTSVPEPAGMSLLFGGAAIGAGVFTRRLRVRGGG